MASSDDQERVDSLNDEMDKLKNSKTNYEDMVSVSTDSEVEAANQSYENMIEFLLVRIENHAKSEGVTIDLVVATSSSGAENVYDLRFTARGSYVGISEFITGIEDDSKLGYKIEDFKMSPSSGDDGGVQATFICRDIKINGISNNTVTPVDTTTKDDEKTDTTDSEKKSEKTNETTSDTNGNT